MSETRKETFERLKAELMTPPSQDIPLPTIVSALEFRREQYGLRQREWSVLLGIPHTNYCDFIHGRRDLPVGARERAFGLGVPAEVLLQLNYPMNFDEDHLSFREAAKKTPEQLKIYNREATRRSRAKKTPEQLRAYNREVARRSRARRKTMEAMK